MKKKHSKRLSMRKILCLMLLFTAQMLFAQTDEYFTYSDDGKSIISGVTEAGIRYIFAENSLSIPANVEKVNHDAFSLIKQYSSAELTQLIIDGGNPEFELSDGKNALADVNHCLAGIEIQGSSMTTENIRKLLTGLNNTGTLEKIDIYNDNFPFDVTITSTAIDENTTGVKIVLPAARVDNQKFGNASVYGRFMLTSEIVTFCGKQLFLDQDVGSQFLFYVPTGIKEDNGEKKVYIERVKYVLPNQGVLLHNVGGSSAKVELPRMEEDDITDDQYETDIALYSENMLKGVTVATPISATEEKEGIMYTNMILYNGLFYPTSGGILSANRAYLQIKKADLGGMAKLPMVVSQEPTDILFPLSPEPTDDVWFSINGQRFVGCPQQPGIYIHQGRKVKK